MMIVMIFIRIIIGRIWIIVRDPRGGRGQAYCVLQVQVIIVNMIMIMIFFLLLLSCFGLLLKLILGARGGKVAGPLCPAGSDCDYY